MPIRSVRHSHARAFVTGLSRSLAPNTARQAHAITRTLFRSAVVDKLIPETPFRRSHSRRSCVSLSTSRRAAVLRATEDTGIGPRRAHPCLCRRRARWAPGGVSGRRGRSDLSGRQGRTGLGLDHGWPLAADSRAGGARGTVNLHHLRHGYASVLNDGGVPFTTVMELPRPSGCYLGDVHAPGQRLGPTGSDVLDIAWRENLADSVRTDLAR